MKLVIGLGNPGEKYKNTRHNAGFIILDKLRADFSFPEFAFEKKFEAEISEGKINDEKTILVKPQTFMNLSGRSVRSILDFYKVTPDDITVIHDDIDIDFGTIRIAVDSSAGGHNGVQDIIDKLGTQRFKRFRIGTLGNEKRKDLKITAEDFVLQKFSEEELETIKNLVEEIKIK